MPGYARGNTSTVPLFLNGPSSLLQAARCPKWPKYRYTKQPFCVPRQAHVHVAYQVLARAGHQRSKHALFKEKAIQDLQETCERITTKRAFIADPVFNFVEDQISAGASTSFGCGIQENKYWAGRAARVRKALSIRLGYQVLRWLRHCASSFEIKTNSMSCIGLSTLRHSRIPCQMCYRRTKLRKRWR